MYQIIKSGTTLGSTEHPTYIKPLDNGSMGLCPESEAHGIAYEGVLYHVEGMPELEGAETVILIEADAGKIADAQALALQAAADELTSTQLALCDVYEMLLA